MAGGQIEILADGWSIQMYGQHKMDSERLINHGVRPTMVPFCERWVNVPENPGKYIRNRSVKSASIIIYNYGAWTHLKSNHRIG